MAVNHTPQMSRNRALRLKLQCVQAIAAAQARRQWEWEQAYRRRLETLERILDALPDEPELVETQA